MASPRPSLWPSAVRGIHRLPDEITTIIFAVYSEALHRLRWRPYIWLSHVCSRWRSILLDMPELWASALEDLVNDYVWRKGRISLMRLCLPRTASLPLDTFEMWQTVPKATWEIFTPHIWRIKRLLIYVPKKQIYQMHRLIGSSMASLEFLDLRTNAWKGIAAPRGQNECTPWQDVNLPHLRTLVLRPAALFSACAVKSLTAVHLQGRISRWGFGPFVRAFQRCPSLEDLTTYEFGFVNVRCRRTPCGHIPLIKLPRLRRLAVRYFNDSTEDLVLFLGRFLLFHPIYFELYLHSCYPEDRYPGWRSNLPDVYPVSRIDTVTSRGTAGLEGRCGKSLCFSEEIEGGVFASLEDVEYFFGQLPQSVHTLCVDGDLPQGSVRPSRKALIDAIPGLRTLRIAASASRYTKLDAAEAFFKRAARSTALSKEVNGSCFELVCVLEEEPAPHGWDDEEKVEFEPRSAAEIKKDLVLLRDIVTACPPRQTWSLTLSLQVRPETELFDAVCRRYAQDPTGRDWEDMAMAIPAFRALAGAVDDMWLVFNDTKLQLSEPFMTRIVE